MEEILDLVNLRRAGLEFDREEIKERTAKRPEVEKQVMAAVTTKPTGATGYLRTENGTAVIPIEGVMAPKMNLLMEISGGVSTEVFANQVLEAAGAEDVRAIIIPIDSPGGSALGLAQAAQAVRAATVAKRVVSIASPMMASAAYYVGSAAEQVVAAPDSMVGSIGTISIHRDTSAAEEEAGLKYTMFTAGEYKGAGAEDFALDDKGRSVRQEIVDEYYSFFVSAVARHRGISPAVVIKRYGEGKILTGNKALEVGMVDRLAMLPEVLGEIEVAAAEASRQAEAARLRHTALTPEPRGITAVLDEARRLGVDEATLGRAYSDSDVYYKVRQFVRAHG
jgi:signal peptide peptidase SppA